MPHLYRSARDLEHWYVFDDCTGWVSFPARIDGWSARRPVSAVAGLGLQEVPLWLSFNTGLPYAVRARRLPHAA
ncbi:MAG TPA: hypothetical protein VHW09_24655 [Bryobacteraceae bacterium]|jgi:hypothetical protein|nr:hypothetical protein [Bryobacteraceae bacterium]